MKGELDMCVGGGSPKGLGDAGCVELHGMCGMHGRYWTHGNAGNQIAIWSALLSQAAVCLAIFVISSALVPLLKFDNFKLAIDTSNLQSHRGYVVMRYIWFRQATGVAGATSSRQLPANYRHVSVGLTASLTAAGLTSSHLRVVAVAGCRSHCCCPPHC